MKRKIKWGLAPVLVLYVFAVILAAMILAGILIMVLGHVGILDLGPFMAEMDFRPRLPLLGMIFFSVLIGTALAAFFSKMAVEPIRRLNEATKKVTRGDFSIQIHTNSIHELEDLYKSFNQMTRELSSTQALRSDFINNFSHEFKTPIVSIRGFAKLLKDGGLTGDERREYLDIIIAESQRLSTLATNVLNLSKYETMEIVAEKEPFYLDEQIRRAIATTEPLWAVRGLTMDVALEEVAFTGNADLIQQIWLNLLDNAIKFSHENGTIHASCTKTAGAIRITVQDHGIGMSEQTRTRIFDKFYQGDESRKQSGNGLGLTMAKRIVELHAGSISVTSQPGHGAKFTVTLPMIN
ncbi:MAG: HAMP domain-containing histidine kinase [Defluviitaleaceae bacterium]|nr:HAMP domain-containing histidine kinase [Defluviitaleaceae bacterium]MCL2204307.1 HAMP domain-containing histidine kinase [Defluviitaleaceae bacterium]MCL2240479.1 HAMP domain-containing histidine kinase [Defluviitaleaceae bacterium]